MTREGVIPAWPRIQLPTVSVVAGVSTVVSVVARSVVVTVTTGSTETSSAETGATGGGVVDELGDPCGELGQPLVGLACVSLPSVTSALIWVVGSATIASITSWAVLPLLTANCGDRLTTLQRGAHLVGGDAERGRHDVEARCRAHDGTEAAGATWTAAERTGRRQRRNDLVGLGLGDGAVVDQGLQHFLQSSWRGRDGAAGRRPGCRRGRSSYRCRWRWWSKSRRLLRAP